MAASAPLFGNLQEYRPENEFFSTYVVRVELIFSANAVNDYKKVAVLLTIIGTKTYSLLRNLVAPLRPQDKSFDDLSCPVQAKAPCYR